MKFRFFLRFAAVFSAFGAAALGAKYQKLKEQKLSLPHGFTVTAHTGCDGSPDNSIESIQRAIFSDVPVIENDLTLRTDGTPVFMHAESAGDGGLLFAEAQYYIASNSSTVLQNLDLKVFENLDQIQSIVKKAGLIGRCFFTGVEKDNAAKVKKYAPEIPYYLNMKLNVLRLRDKEYLRRTADEIKHAGAVGINCKYTYLSKALVEVMHECGLSVSVWTVDKKPLMLYVLSLAPDNITTRNPRLLMSLIK